MTKHTANLLSYLFHPALITTYAVAMMFNSGADYPYYSSHNKLIILGLVFLLTTILPLCTTPIYINLGLIRNIYMSSHRERTIPLIVSSLAYCLAFYMLNRIQVNNFLQIFMLASAGLIFLAGSISYFWKISAHTMGAGSIIGTLLAFSLRYEIDVTGWLCLSLLLSGALASARLYLGSHNQLQIYTGFAVGVIYMLPILLFTT